MHYRIVMPPNIGAAQVLRQTLAWLKEDRDDAGGPGAAVEGLLQSGEVCCACKVRRYPLRSILHCTCEVG